MSDKCDDVIDFNASGSKYLRKVPCLVNGHLDVYAVLDAYNVTCPAIQHAVKKLLCTGIRGKADYLQDLNEAYDAIARAIQMQEARDTPADLVGQSTIPSPPNAP